LKTVSILGSTGSIGLSSLRVIDEFPGLFNVEGLCCNNNITLLKEQIIKYKPSFVCIVNNSSLKNDLLESLIKSFPDVKFYFGYDSLLEFVQNPVDILLSAIAGSAGLIPTLKAIPHIKRLAIANKETLVMAGDIVKRELNRYNVEMLPVDSEHSAVFALMDKRNISDVKKIILTASGGSLRDVSSCDMKNVTVEKALSHPNWSMGSKITIDSATLMNKGLEVIEAHHLFSKDYDDISVVIHPESYIHSMIEFVDGSVLAHIGVPDMVFPISYSFLYPEMRSNNFGTVDFVKIGSLTFKDYDPQRFPALNLAYHAGRTGETMTAVMNAANEIAVTAFINKRISFLKIIDIVSEVMDIHEVVTNPNIDNILDADLWAKKKSEEIIRSIEI